MRILVQIKFDTVLPDNSERKEFSDDRSLFWLKAYIQHRALRGLETERDSVLDFNKYIFSQEQRIKSSFGNNLLSLMRPSLGLTEVFIIRYLGHSYGSLDLSFELISSALDKMGVEVDDIIGIMGSFTPEAMQDTTGMDRDDVKYNIRARIIEVSYPKDTSENIKEASENKTSSNSSDISRGKRIWWISNMSLILPSIILLAAAYFMFKSTQEERSKMTDAMVQERIRIAEQQDKSADRYSEIAKQLQEFLKSQIKNTDKTASDEKKDKIENKSIEPKNNNLILEPVR